jgi:hypothetical protein
VGALYAPARLGTYSTDDAREKSAPHLGDYLVRRGLLSRADLHDALAQHTRVGVHLGSVLLARGLISRRVLYQALGDLWGIEACDLDDLDVALVRAFDPQEMVRDGWVPVRATRRSDGSCQEVQVAVAGRLNDHIVQRVRTKTGARHVSQVVTTDWDIRRVVRDCCTEALVETAVEGLARSNPEASAQRVITKAQVTAILVALSATLLFALARPRALIVVLAIGVNMMFMVSVVFKLLVSLVGATKEHKQVVSDEEVAAMKDADLPLFTILVPAYHEANVIGSLMSNLACLDYPREKLEILLLLEPDDPETLQAAKAAGPPDVVKFIVVPEGGPKTKPKACNVGLMFARGEYLVIYDAEDRPEPDQLKKVVATFAKSTRDLVCVQAALNYFNSEENVLTRMFTLEYSYWFDYMLPGLDTLGLPIPLGGTSNHFRTEMLRELGGWDPYNVTEDADLGIRASALGSRVRVVNSTTYEEANRAFGNWIRQRSRWIKGYMQTVLVHTRHPVRLVRTVGLRQTFGFALLIGGTPVSFLMAPILWTVFAISTADPRLLAGIFPRWLQIANMLTLFGGNASIIYLNMLAVFKRRRYRLIWFGLLNPFYWILHSIASVQALWQLLNGRAFFWEKTLHGLSRLADEGSAGFAPARLPLDLAAASEVGLPAVHASPPTPVVDPGAPSSPQHVTRVRPSAAVVDLAAPGVPRNGPRLANQPSSASFLATKPPERARQTGIGGSATGSAGERHSLVSQHGEAGRHMPGVAPAYAPLHGNGRRRENVLPRVAEVLLRRPRRGQHAPSRQPPPGHRMPTDA